MFVIASVRADLINPYPSIKGKVMVIYSMPETMFTKRQGMFADFFAVLGALHYAEIKEAAGVQVIFDTAFYVDPEKGSNYWTYFFPNDTIWMRPFDSMNDEEKRRIPRVHFDKYIAKYGKLGSFSQIVLPSSSGNDLPSFPSEYFLKPDILRNMTSQYLKLRPDFVAQVQKFRDEHVQSGQFLLAVHYRGTDKILNYPYRSPSGALLDHYIQAGLEYFRPTSYRIFVATDSQEFLSRMIQKYGDKVFYYESPRISSADPDARHGVHKSTRFGAYQKAASSLMDCLLLSSADYLVKTRSSLSDMSIYFGSPNMHWTALVDDTDPALGTLALPSHLDLEPFKSTLRPKPP